jgi:23S rRNA (cytosine1962-C5)-methyltransferase
MSSEAVLTLKPGRDKSVRRRHPWIFSGAVAGIAGEPQPGDTVRVVNADGNLLARAAYSPRSQIAGRIWTWETDEPVDASFFRRHIEHAIQARAALAVTTNALRWVNAENDGLPGLIVDRYAGFGVCQYLTAGAEHWKHEIADVVAAQAGIKCVYERSDVDVRSKEGLPQSSGLLRGASPPDVVEVCEGEWQFAVDIVRGHKTGFYLDQRDNRRAVAGLARGRDVLNAFAYTGAFAVAALRSGAKSVVSIDSAAAALEIARQNLRLNNLPEEGLREGDVFRLLREYRDSGQSFDMVILDPPKFAQTQAQLNRATRAYKDINWLAFRLLRPGGYLITFSCSGLVTDELFQKIVFGAALDAGRNAQIVGRLTQASDHPVRLTFPEGWYLKGLICKVEEA